MREVYYFATLRAKVGFRVRALVRPGSKSSLPAGCEFAGRGDDPRQRHARHVPATWYVLGPGHRWPYALVPLYWLLKSMPFTREKARRLDLVSLPHVLAAQVEAVQHPPAEWVRIVDVPELRNTPRLTMSASR